MHYPYSMGETAENVARRWEVGRDLQDELRPGVAAEGLAAIEAGRSTARSSRSRFPSGSARHRGVRATSTPSRLVQRGLAEARPAFRDGGTVTAGNSSGINDGASAVLLVEAGRRANSDSSAGPNRVDRGGRSRSGGDGDRPGTATKKAGTCWHRRKRPRTRRAQRGFASQSIVCISARPGSRQGQRQRWGHRPRSPAGDERRAAHHDARPRAATNGRALWPCHEVSASARESRRSSSGSTADAAGRSISAQRLSESVAQRTIGPSTDPITWRQTPRSNPTLPRRIVSQCWKSSDRRQPDGAAASKLRDLTAEETNPQIGLRVYVYSGGCSGFRYGMMLEDAPTAEDKSSRRNGVKVYVDGNSVELLKGPDRLRRYAHGRGFHREQSDAVAACGCGSSFRTADDTGSPKAARTNLRDRFPTTG